MKRLTWKPSKAQSKTISRLTHPSSYDPSDQFFQAFKAGRDSYVSARLVEELGLETATWRAYVAWLCEKPK